MWTSSAAAAFAGLGLLALGFLETACDAPEVRYAAGVIDVTVMGSRPIAGATVRVSHIDWHGVEPPELIVELQTDAEGKGTAEVGLNYDTFLIESVGGTTEELLTGEEVALDPTARMAAVVTIRADEKVDVWLTPITTMAEALGDARLARGDKEETYRDAHGRALELVGAHFGDINDPVRTRPTDPTTEIAGTLSEEVRAGLMIASLSQVAVRIAETSGVSANVVNTVVLTEALAADLASDEALFDGTSAEGDITIGACPVPEPCSDAACSTICDLGPRTVRGYVADELRAFVTSDANVTAIGEEDIAEMKSAIAGDTEPELFGDAPVETEGPTLTVSPQGFYVDAATDIWWTADASFALHGTVSTEVGGTVTVVATVNDDVTADAEIANDDTWTAVLPDALDPAPLSNALHVVATDGVGNQASIDLDVRLDDGPPDIGFDDSTIIDERADTITFSPGPPVHTHGGPSTTLGGASCAAVYKHVTLMNDPTNNPLTFRFHATDAGAGIAPASVAYRVRRQGGAAWLLDWTTPETVTPVTSGWAYEATLLRADILALGTTAGNYEIQIRGSDLAGESVTDTACWSYTPLGGPLKTENVTNGGSTTPGTGLLGSFKLENNNLAPLINGVTVANGAGLMSFDVLNYNTEPVYFTVGWTQPSMSGTKSWRSSAFLSSVQAVNLNCFPTGSEANCNSGWGTFETHDVNNVAASIANPVTGARVTDSSNADQGVASCPGCASNRFQIAARVSASTPRRYRVTLVATDLSGTPATGIFPGATDTASYVEGTAGTLHITADFNETLVRCTDVVTMLGPPPDFEIESQRCLERTTYGSFVALKAASLTVGSTATLTSIISSSAAATGAAFELPSLDRPELPTPYSWTTTDTMPTPPSGMP